VVRFRNPIISCYGNDPTLDSEVTADSPFQGEKILLIPLPVLFPPSARVLTPDFDLLPDDPRFGELCQEKQP
jgi:hypothetical protein